MNYVVSTYARTPGTTSIRRVREVRRTHVVGAIIEARAQSEAATFATVSKTSPTGRILIGTAREGEYQPATKEDAPMATTKKRAAKPAATATKSVTIPVAKDAPAPRPVKWKAQKTASNGYSRITGARQTRAIVSVYLGGDEERSAAILDAVLGLPGLVEATRNLLAGELGKSKSANVLALKAALAKMPSDETLRSL